MAIFHQLRRAPPSLALGLLPVCQPLAHNRRLRA